MTRNTKLDRLPTLVKALGESADGLKDPVIPVSDSMTGVATSFVSE
ncbi:MAG: hypothetical protein U0975_04590 [Erythrobacter sp.]|nr:hypothetical protein [Erythrobacter sp.]MDZ4271930.1 hypothetical protein [Erythrobacter sp.]